MQMDPATLWPEAAMGQSHNHMRVLVILVDAVERPAELDLRAAHAPLWLSLSHPTLALLT